MQQIPKATQILLFGQRWQLISDTTMALLESILQGNGDPESIREAQRLMGFDPARVVKSAREILGLPDPKAEVIGRNLMKD